MSRTEMTTPDYSAARHDETMRQQCRRARIPPLGVDLNAYYWIGDQNIMVPVQAGAIFLQWRTGTLYFYKEDVEGFGNANGEA